MSGFSRPPLAIKIDADYFPFDDNYLYGPGGFDNPVLRIYVHEVLHFWQTLSQGFLTDLALGEWQQLLKYEQTGDPSPQEELRIAYEHFYEPHPELGFSTWNLYEAMCRYWDIHIIGPAKLIKQHPELSLYPPDSPLIVRMVDGLPQYSSFAFDLLMEVEDAYAAPYRIALEQWGSGYCVILFPLVGYFALQSPSPVDVFVDATKSLKQSLKMLDQRGFVIHEMWPKVFSHVRDVCVESCSRALQGAHLVTGWDIMRNSPLAEHPVYGHYLELLTSTSRHWGQKIHYCFALPGDPNCRKWLAEAFRPAVTIFNNGRWTGETVISFSTRLFDKGAKQVKDENVLADLAEDINRRFQQMRQAALIARYTMKKS